MTNAPHFGEFNTYVVFDATRRVQGRIEVRRPVGLKQRRSQRGEK